MDEEGISSAHLGFLLGLEIEGAGSLDCGGVHGVDAVGEFVG